MFPQAVPAPAPPRPYSVSELLGEVGQALRTSWRDISVAGEIGRWELRGGHGYFNLKDRNGCLNAIIFASDLKRVPFQVKAGQEVVVRGSLDLFAPQGKFQIKVSAIEPVGAGALQLAFEQLKEKLAAEGLFEKSRKRPIPFLPRRIAIVTSPDGAAIRDILQIARRRFDGLAVTIYPARVQGAGAAAEIVEGIRVLNRRGGFDVLVLARGGGSAEDLAAFNDERVARALAASQIPTISAIGHETDWTICDFVADLRAPTPSAAAELVVAAKEEVRRRVGGAASRVRRAMAASLASRQRDLGRLARADGLLAFPWKLRERREAVAQIHAALVDTLERRPGQEAQRLARAVTALRSFARVAELSRKRDFFSALERELQARMARTIDAGSARLQTAAEKLHLVSPLAVLARGYAIAWKDGKRSPILSADEVRIGDGIRVRLHEGEIRAVVRQGGVRKSSDLGPLFATETSGE
ncbi:MAG: exodeoxyribonuclease VII large subunit [Acidobacteriota bacterium]|nr:exodeoxyribonuclease VII large subunit [Acidobacteriota bacterium]